MGIACGDVNGDGAARRPHHALLQRAPHALVLARCAGGRDTFFLDVTYPAGPRRRQPADDRLGRPPSPTSTTTAGSTWS